MSTICKAGNNQRMHLWDILLNDAEYQIDVDSIEHRAFAYFNIAYLDFIPLWRWTGFYQINDILDINVRYFV